MNYIGDEAMNISSALAWIGDHDVTPYDTVVVLVGMNDAVRLTRLSVWSRRFEELMSKLVEETRSTTRILVVGMQPVRSILPYDSVLGSVAQIHATRWNRAAAEIARRTGRADFVPLGTPEREPERPLGSPGVYRAWAREIAEHAAPLLDAVRIEEGDARVPAALPSRSFAWEGGAALVEQAMTGGSEELQRLATEAQKSFSVDVAAVTLVDGDRLWYAVNTHLLPMSIPSEVAYCSTVVAQDGFLEVPNAQRDPRFRGNPFIDVTGMDFYAGYPLHASDGRTIGTFCLLNRRTRPAGTVPVDELRALALQAQTELRRYEPQSDSPADRRRPRQRRPKGSAASLPVDH